MLQHGDIQSLKEHLLQLVCNPSDLHRSIFIDDLDFFDVLLGVFVELVEDAATDVQDELKSSQFLEGLELVETEVLLGKGFGALGPVAVPISTPEIP